MGSALFMFLLSSLCLPPMVQYYKSLGLVSSEGNDKQELLSFYLEVFVLGDRVLFVQLW